MPKPPLSVVVPVYNEAEALQLLHVEIQKLYTQYPGMEVIYIDDGSKDKSLNILKEIASKDTQAVVISFVRNQGQTAALKAGIDAAKGDIIVPIDSDLENNPADIPKLIALLDQGYEVVSGWRQNRWEGSFLKRKLPSLLANSLISWGTGVKLHDWGCTLKAYKREVIVGVPLYGEMHRFIPAYASWQGARVTELPVSYQARPFGKSNYGLSRTFRVLLDLFLIRFLAKYMNRPIHFFGGWGFVLFFMGILTGLIAIGLRIFIHLHLVETPLPTLTALLCITGLNLIMMGVLSEMLMRTHWEVMGGKNSHIKERVN